MRFKLVLVGVLACATMAVFAATAGASGAPGPFSQGFETNTAGWFDDSNSPPDSGTLTREPSGYVNGGGYADGIASASGGFHARIGSTDCVNDKGPGTDCYGPYTLWGTDGSSTVFPAGGFTTQVSIYLDVVWAANHPDVRFDWDTAMQSNTGSFLSDYVFNAGTEPSGPGAFVIGASPNAFRGNTFPENPCPNPGPANPPNVCRTPVVITTSGWYTFRHSFHDDGTGHLAADMMILDSGGNPVASWTIYQGFATSMVGGPAYGWFANEEIPDLPIDSTSLSSNLQGQKQDVLNQVNAAIPGASKHDADKLKDASKKLTDSLTPSNWIDANHLQPKKGDHVFDDEKDAVHTFMDLQKDKNTQISDATLQGWIDSLVAVDSGLAQTEINDATSAGGDAKKLADAQNEMSKAADSLSKGKYDEAIDHYKNAWHKAEESVKAI